MEAALRRFAPCNQVSATEATRGESYICPICRAPVTLRAGWARAPYFAHMPGTGRIDCELYFSSLHQWRDVGPDQHSLLGQPWEMAIGLNLSKGGHPRGWSIELSVPTRGIDNGEIQIDVGGRLQIVRLAGNTASARRMTAEPQSKPYRLVSIEPENNPLSRRINRSCCGLRAQGATVFGDIARPGSQLIPRATKLHTELTYAFIWNDSIEPKFPDELDTEDLLGRPGWKGKIATISGSVSEACRAWLEDFTGISLVDSTPSFVPVWPPVALAVTARYLEVIQHTPLILFLSGALSSNEREVPPVFAKSGTEALGVSSIPGELPFFGVTNGNETSMCVVCPKIQGAFLELDFRPAPASVFAASVVLSGQTAEGELTTSLLHSEQAAGWLAQVRTGSVSSLVISFPDGCQGELSVGNHGVWTKQAQWTNASPDVNTLVSQALGNPRRDVMIDFGALGRAISCAVESSSFETTSLALPRKTRAQLLAYLKQFQNRPRWPLRLARGQGSKSLVDDFINTVPGRSMMPLHNALTKEIRKLKCR